MSFLEFATRMSPYWLMGAFVGYSIWNSSYRDLLAINKKSITKFVMFMAAMTLWRVFSLKAALHLGMSPHVLEPVAKLPIAGTLFTPWEDLSFSAPLVLLRRILGTGKWMMPVHWILMGLTMASFGSGHLYEGVLSACLVSLYIPFAVDFASKKGFGTLCIGHVVYDFTTIMAVKFVLGLHG